MVWGIGYVVGLPLAQRHAAARCTRGVRRLLLLPADGAVDELLPGLVGRGFMLIIVPLIIFTKKRGWGPCLSFY